MKRLLGFAVVCTLLLGAVGPVSAQNLTPQLLVERAEIPDQITR